MYIELHSRSAFSFLEGSSVPEDLVSRCAELQMSGMALLDRDGVYGAPRFHMAAKKAKLKAHIGAAVTCNVSHPPIACNVSVGNATRIATRHKTLQATSLQNASDEFRLPVLISSRAGYQNLCRMITKMKLRSKKNEGAVYEEELSQHAKGLICLTGGDDGPLAHA